MVQHMCAMVQHTPHGAIGAVRFADAAHPQWRQLGLFQPFLRPVWLQRFRVLPGFRLAQCRGFGDAVPQWRVAHARGARVMIDSTFATPVNQRPLDDGADLVIHSATKYLGGHNDLLAGVVAGPSELVEPIRDAVGVLGGVLDAHGAWLLLRGLKSLALRVARHGGAVDARGRAAGQWGAACGELRCVRSTGRRRVLGVCMVRRH